MNTGERGEGVVEEEMRERRELTWNAWFEGRGVRGGVRDEKVREGPPATARTVHGTTECDQRGSEVVQQLLKHATKTI